MLKHIDLNIFILCLSLVLFGCGGEGNAPAGSEGGVSATDPQELLKDAVKKQEIGAFAEALESLSRAVEINPKFAPAYYRMGLIYEDLEKKREAVGAYKKVLEIDPENVDARLGLGSAYAKMVRNDLAVEEYKKVARARPDDPEVHFKIALQYWYIQNLPETARHYLKVIEIDPRHMQAHLNLASVYERMKEWGKSLEQIDIAKQLGKENKDEQAVSIAESKLAFIKGRMNVTDEEFKRRSSPPFE